MPISEPPGWLMGLLRKPVLVFGRTDWATVETLAVTVGDRTNTLCRLSGHLFRKSVDPHVAFSLLWAWNVTACRPPLALDKFEKTLNGIQSRELARRARP